MWDGQMAIQVIPLAITALVLVLVASGRFRFDVVAVAGLMLVGVLRIAPPALLFSGFGSPALFTIMAVLLISEGITEARLFSGLGQALESRLRKREHQILGLALTTSLLSVIMNNVGALSLTLPTAVKMAHRGRLSPGTYTMPMVYGAILGGTITLIGSAPNIIVSAYRAEILGQPYGMFDFAPHGLTFVFVGLLLWLICRACGFNPGGDEPVLLSADQNEDPAPPDRFPQDILSTPAKRITLFTVVPSVVLVSLGVLSPSVAFGTVAVILVSTGVMNPSSAYRKLDFSVVVFVGAMLGLARVLEQTGALSLLTSRMMPVFSHFPPVMLVGAVFLVSSLLSIVINNAAAAALMAPLTVDLAGAASLDSLLMAVAAGSCLSMILPTHQATVIAMGRGWFSPARFARTGALLTLVCAAVGSLVILLVWSGR